MFDNNLIYASAKGLKKFVFRKDRFLRLSSILGEGKYGSCQPRNTKIFCCEKIFLTAMKDMGIIVAILAFNDGKGDKV
ncbi:MAG: hypothetical protein ABSC57_03095 [Syntrophales bacterium]